MGDKSPIRQVETSPVQTAAPAGDFYPVMSTLAEVLRRLMKERGMTMRQLSLAAGLNEGAVKNILSGKSKSPRGATINALAGALKVPASLLLAADAGRPENMEEINVLRWYRMSSRANQQSVYNILRTTSGEGEERDQAEGAHVVLHASEPPQAPLLRRPRKSRLHEDPTDFTGPKK